MAISIEEIKELRGETGMSVTDVKHALEESGGDSEKAKALLRSRGAEIALKKQEREAAEGIIEAYRHQTGKTGVLLDLRCETDFVAKGEDFQALAHELVLQIAALAPESTDDLLEQEYIKDSSRTVRSLLEEYVAKLGENIVIARFERYQI